MGYMTIQFDDIAKAFINFACAATKPVLDIGTAYGTLALAVAAEKKHIIANDIDQRHLDHMMQQATLEQKKYLQPLMGNFPENLYFQDNSIGAISILRVLHFFAPERWLLAAQTLFRWLQPGGKVFITNESPYFGTMRDFIPIYLKRKRMHYPWPGLMNNMEYFDPARKKDVHSVINLLSISETKAILEEVGFKIELIRYLDRQGMYPQDALYDGRESVGVIAVKPNNKT
jgi:SAM-dependent methyltransferase